MQHNKCILMVGMFAIALFMPHIVEAGQVLMGPLCQLAYFVRTGVGAAIATVAVIVIGIGALMGKVSWGMAIIVALGIALIFGAGAIAEAIGAAGATSCGESGVTTGGDF